jgi:hypothetical protein
VPWHGFLLWTGPNRHIGWSTFRGAGHRAIRSFTSKESMWLRLAVTESNANVAYTSRAGRSEPPAKLAWNREYLR